MPLDFYGEGDYYGDTGLYHNDFADNPVDHYAFHETQCHRLSVKVTYVAPASGYGSFKIHSIRPRLSPIRQGSYTHEAFIDQVTPSNHLSVSIQHSGSELIISHIQLITQRKHKQPIG